MEIIGTMMLVIENYPRDSQDIKTLKWENLQFYSAKEKNISSHHYLYIKSFIAYFSSNLHSNREASVLSRRDISAQVWWRTAALPSILFFVHYTKLQQKVPLADDWLTDWFGVCRCIDKVFMEEKTEWETVVTCEHSYNRRCAKSLITVYNSAQVKYFRNYWQSLLNIELWMYFWYKEQKNKKHVFNILYRTKTSKS